jgi:hypothetical protein
MSTWMPSEDMFDGSMCIQGVLDVATYGVYILLSQIYMAYKEVWAQKNDTQGHYVPIASYKMN